MCQNNQCFIQKTHDVDKFKCEYEMKTAEK